MLVLLRVCIFFSPFNMLEYQFTSAKDFFWNEKALRLGHSVIVPGGFADPKLRGSKKKKWRLLMF